jgi:GntR family transcriptional regulator/MocR family aminotransferase
MSEAILYLDSDSDLNLQAQIRQKLVEAITLGTFPADTRLPSSRKLSDQLKVARNTVVLAYQQLMDEGYLISHERSGIFVNEAIFEGRLNAEDNHQTTVKNNSHWQRHIRSKLPEPRSFNTPPTWQQYPYPFLDGQLDHSLFPIKEWREANRQALAIREIQFWSSATSDADDPMLIEEIRTKILPRRGIQATAEEILITIGSQQALYLVNELLVDSNTSAAVEEPGYPEMRQLLTRRGATLVHQPVDDEGMVVDERLDKCDVIFITPSHQTPTAVTMSIERRKALLNKAELNDSIIIEDDYEFESNYLSKPTPALKSIGDRDRVIYLSSISKVLAPGLRLGFMVAPHSLIKEARKLRKLMVQHPPMNNQRTAAYFLSMGHYDSFLMHLHKTFRQRWTALRSALNHYLLHFVVTSRAQGGSTCWVRGPEGLDVKYLAQEAARKGILIEPVEDYYAKSNADKNCFRLGVTSLPQERIRDGVAQLAELIQELSTGSIETLANAKGKAILGCDVASILSDRQLLCKTVYGDPCVIDILADGRLIGKAGFSNETRDSGKWWVENDLWFRQWEQWEYGETSAFHLVLDGNRIKFFNEKDQLYDTAILTPNEQPL